MKTDIADVQISSYKFRQGEPPSSGSLTCVHLFAATDFFYLTGFNEPDATLVLGESELSCQMLVDPSTTTDDSMTRVSSFELEGIQVHPVRSRL